VGPRDGRKREGPEGDRLHGRAPADRQHRGQDHPGVRRRPRVRPWQPARHRRALRVQPGRGRGRHAPDHRLGQAPGRVRAPRRAPHAAAAAGHAAAPRRDDRGARRPDRAVHRAAHARRGRSVLAEAPGRQVQRLPRRRERPGPGHLLRQGEGGHQRQDPQDPGRRRRQPAGPAQLPGAPGRRGAAAHGAAGHLRPARLRGAGEGSAPHARCPRRRPGSVPGARLPRAHAADPGGRGLAQPMC